MWNLYVYKFISGRVLVNGRPKCNAQLPISRFVFDWMMMPGRIMNNSVAVKANLKLSLHRFRRAMTDNFQLMQCMTTCWQILSSLSGILSQRPPWNAALLPLHQKEKNIHSLAPHPLLHTYPFQCLPHPCISLRAHPSDQCLCQPDSQGKAE